MTFNTHANTASCLTAAIAALQKQYPKGKFTFDGVPYTTASLVTLFQSALKALNAAAAAKSASTKAVAAATKATNEAKLAYAGLVNFVKLTDGSTSQTLVEFGQPVRARKVPTVEVKAAAKQKRQATLASKHATVAAQTPAATPETAPAAVTPSTATSKS